MATCGRFLSHPRRAVAFMARAGLKGRSETMTQYSAWDLLFGSPSDEAAALCLNNLGDAAGVAETGPGVIWFWNGQIFTTLANSTLYAINDDQIAVGEGPAVASGPDVAIMVQNGVVTDLTPQVGQYATCTG